MDIQSALVVGGDSLIARALRIELLSAGWNVLSTTRRQEKRNGWLNFDLKHGFYSLPNAAVEKTNVVFICGAVTGFEQCANDPVGSREINVTRSLEIGRSFMQRGTRVVYLSVMLFLMVNVPD